MRFFEDHRINKESLIGITNLLSNITTRLGSHKGGWARLLKCQLHNMGFKHVKILDNKDSLSNFDVVIFDLGAEYSGALNLFGGLDEKVFKRLNEIKTYSGSIYSWRNQLPDVSVLESRRNNPSTCESFKQAPASFLSEVQQVLVSTKVFDHAYRSDSLLIGDSHTPSVWTPRSMIERRDGRTLRGMLDNNTIEKYINQFKDSGVEIKHVHVHCSSIDIRHHLCRELNPKLAVANLARMLIHQLSELKTNVTLTHTMGIEDESRDLPKTGYFKGTPFYGTWEERNVLRQIFNAIINEIAIPLKWEVIKFPDYFFDETGKLKFEVMEVPGSVHLSPEHYRWNLEQNRNWWDNYKELTNRKQS